MVDSQRPVFTSLDFLNKGNCDLSNSLMNKVLELKGKNKRCSAQSTSTQERFSSGFTGGSCMTMKTRSRTRFLMKRRASLDRNRRRPLRPAGDKIERKLRILKKLIPNSESREMDTLFQETADCIFALQMRVNAMQIMVDVLSGSDHHR